MMRITANSKDKRAGRVWSREDQNAERDVEAFGMNMCCAEALPRPPVPGTTCKQYGAISLLSTFPTRRNVRFLHGDPITQKSARPNKCEAVPQESGFSVPPRTTNHKGVPETKASKDVEVNLQLRPLVEITLEEHHFTLQSTDSSPHAPFLSPQMPVQGVAPDRQWSEPSRHFARSVNPKYHVSCACNTGQEQHKDDRLNTWMVCNTLLLD